MPGWKRSPSNRAPPARPGTTRRSGARTRPGRFWRIAAPVPSCSPTAATPGTGSPRPSGGSGKPASNTDRRMTPRVARIPIRSSLRSARTISSIALWTRKAILLRILSRTDEPVPSTSERTCSPVRTVVSSMVLCSSPSRASCMPGRTGSTASAHSTMKAEVDCRRRFARALTRSHSSSVQVSEYLFWRSRRLIARGPFSPPRGQGTQSHPAVTCRGPECPSGVLP